MKWILPHIADMSEVWLALNVAEVLQSLKSEIYLKKNNAFCMVYWNKIKMYVSALKERIIKLC